MMHLIRILLFPVSILYGIVMWLRNLLYDKGLFKSTEFKIPVISIGNIVWGGTGKTPMTEYLARLLLPEFNIAVLSRGYKRSKKGFHMVADTDTAKETGDEPVQIKSKFNDLVVAVDANRIRGIHNLRNAIPDLKAVILDDAFQHRKVKPGLNIVLTDYGNLFFTNMPIPSGSLREFPSAMKRADIIIVTKTPSIFSPIERRRVIEKIKPTDRQQIFFSYIKYGNLVPLSGGDAIEGIQFNVALNAEMRILLVTGIANATPLKDYLNEKIARVEHIEYMDHHKFTKRNLNSIQSRYTNFAPDNKLIITTEKDAMRLLASDSAELVKQLPFYYIPIEFEFHPDDKDVFDSYVFNYVNRG